jgi:hypothetical protein
MSGVVGGVGTLDERINVAVINLRKLMKQFYDAMRGTRKLTEVNDLTVSMLGAPSDPSAKPKVLRHLVSYSF